MPKISQSPAREDEGYSTGLGSPGLQGLARILQEDHAAAWEGLSCRSGSASLGGLQGQPPRLQDEHAARGCEVSTSYGSDGSPGRSPGLSPGLSQALRDRLHQDFDIAALARRSEQASLVQQQALGTDATSQSSSREQGGIRKASASLMGAASSRPPGSARVLPDGSWLKSDSSRISLALRDEQDEVSMAFAGMQHSAAAMAGQHLPESPSREGPVAPMSPASGGSPGWSGLAQVLADLEEVLPTREEARFSKSSGSHQSIIP